MNLRHSGYLIVLALLGGLGHVLVQAQAEMELAQVSIIVRNIRSGLQIAIGERLMRGEDTRLAELLQANPLRFLGRQPEGYIGETAVADGAGSWRFDPTTRLLEYRPRHPDAFGGRSELHWRVDATGIAAGRPIGMRLDAV